MTTVDISHVHKIIRWLNEAAGEGIMLPLDGVHIGADELLWNWQKDMNEGWCDPSMWPKSVLKEWE